MAELKLVDQASGRPVVERLEVADSYWKRLVGLQFRSCLPAGAGLLLVPCASVHTFWMRFSIDVAGLDRFGRVTSVRRGLQPWRIARMPRGTVAVLELPAGSSGGLDPGDRLRLCGSSLSKRLQFLQN